jgi:hypothetical protein
MSFLERYLAGVCAELALLLRTRIEQRDLDGSPIDRARTFSTKICCLTGPNQQSWDKLKQLQKLRNRFVHSAELPSTTSEQRKLTNMCTGLPGIIVTEFGVDLEQEFIKDVFRHMYEFLGQMSAAIKEVNERIKQFESEA